MSVLAMKKTKNGIINTHILSLNGNGKLEEIWEEITWNMVWNLVVCVRKDLEDICKNWWFMQQHMRHRTANIITEYLGIG